jgi:anthranilate synthase component 1
VYDNAAMSLTCPLPNLDLLDLHRLAPTRYPVLLESSASGTPQGRWDLLLVADGTSLRLDADSVVRDSAGAAHGRCFLGALDAAWRRERIGHDEHDATGLPFAGGWALLLDYELATQVEPVVALPMPVGGAPVAVVLRCPAAVLRDRRTGACTAVCESGAQAWLHRIVEDAHRVEALAPPVPWTPPQAVDEAPADRFTAGVRRVLDYLAAGDVFQVNLSRGWSAQFDAPPSADALFRRLREHNPAPFAGIFVHEGRAVVSASPERLVSVRGDIVETRPIAGTRPRVAGDDDALRIGELVGHPKERAEHVMLIDLERNDLGRVCAPGSVEVDELMAVESYAHVHHIVSNVRGRLRAGVTPGEVIRAVFPGGTITGCPKVRCMQIIAELEGEPRGAYTGAMGWLAHDGDMDLNILIRSATLDGDMLRFRTGAGIVVDSDPERELEETRAKARGMLRALG